MLRIIFIAFLFVTGCKLPHAFDSTYDVYKIDTIITVSSPSVTSAPKSLCYQWNNNRDSALMQLTFNGNNVTGNLQYNFFKKDDYTGPIKGVINNGLIETSYTYVSEAGIVIKEMVFKVKGDALIKAIGELETNGDTIKYKNKSELKFNNDRKFIKVDCEE